MRCFNFVWLAIGSIFFVACGDDGVSAQSRTMTDLRDGRTYQTVRIGMQTWMAENLNYEATSSHCYNDDVTNCTKYGRLYSWAVAMDSASIWSMNGNGCGYNKSCSPIYPVRGVCPEGWHLPSKVEWETLLTVVGGRLTAGRRLKSTFGWSNGNGTDAFGFSALPAGQEDSNFYLSEGEITGFWSSTEEYSESAYFMMVYGDEADVFSHYVKYSGFSVRCVKD